LVYQIDILYRITGIVEDDVFAVHVKNIGLKMFTWREEKKNQGIINLLLNKNEKKEKLGDEDQ
jgi:hypothetical protein